MADLAPSPDSPASTVASRLWKLVFVLAVLVVTVGVANAFLPPDRAIGRGLFGHDFLAFYSAGRLVSENRGAELYDMNALADVQRAVALKADLQLEASVAPWWNPPHVALLFAPLSHLSFHAALALWTTFGLACLAITALLWMGVIRDVSERKTHWLLVPALLLLAPPTLQAIGHGQNTPLSLLLLTLTVLAWRAREPIWAGLCCSLLCYKPQLAAVVFIALTLTLGWRVWVGVVVGAIPQLLLTVTKLPGSISTYLDQLPRNLNEIQFAQPYPWHRHSTLSGFFRHQFQGNGAGDTFIWITALSATCAVVIGAAVLFIFWKRRGELRDEILADRFISLVILAMPLVMPFYFDYDLLLLFVPALLIAREQLIGGADSNATRWLIGLGSVTYVWTLLNPPLAETFSLNLTVPLLCALVGLQATRCLIRSEPAASISLPTRAPQRLAA